LLARSVGTMHRQKQPGGEEYCRFPKMPIPPVETAPKTS
jgi:hypothetical protein